jgi:hypothetical protein
MLTYFKTFVSAAFFLFCRCVHFTRLAQGQQIPRPKAVPCTSVHCWSVTMVRRDSFRW